MPLRAPHGCAEPGCPGLVVDAARCAAHARSVRAHVDARRGSAHSRGYGVAWRATRLRFLQKHPLCEDCLLEGRSVPATDVDHVVSRAKGGTDDPRNLRALCHPHHSSKTAREDGRWARRF